MACKISVVIPVYNTEKYLKACIDSIIHQTFKDFEIILVDDGSTDASGIICEAYAAKYEYISVIHKENGGPAHSRKVGFYASKGLYISYIDSDDCIVPDMYEKMMSEAERYNADMVICDISEKSDTGDIFVRNSVEPGFYDKARLKEKVYAKLLIGGRDDSPGIMSQLGNKIIRREILENVLECVDDRISFGEDALCTVPCLLSSQRVYFSDEALYCYRIVETSISHTYHRKRMQEVILLIRQLDKVFKEYGFEASGQLNTYAARNSIVCIRSELLFNKEESVRKRIEIVKEYLKDTRIAEAIAAVSTDELSRVNHIKIRLIKEKRLFALYLVYYIKSIMMGIC